MMMRIMIMIIKVNLQMPIWWQQVNNVCRKMNDDDEDNDNNKSESPNADMVAASEHWVWRDG